VPYRFSGFEGNVFVSQSINNDFEFEFEFGFWYGIGLYLDGLFQGIVGLSRDEFLGTGNSGYFCLGMVDSLGFELISNRIC
jgi:hypothetical protein